MAVYTIMDRGAAPALMSDQNNRPMLVMTDDDDIMALAEAIQTRLFELERMSVDTTETEERLRRLLDVMVEEVPSA